MSRPIDFTIDIPRNVADAPKTDIYADIWSKLTIAISLYGRIEPSNGATLDDLPMATLLYCECVLSQAKLALAVWISEGWNSNALKLLTTGIDVSAREISPASRLANSERSGLSCSQVAGILTQAHGPFLLHLEAHDRMKVLNNQAALYSYTGLLRKEAIILREILSTLLDMLDNSRRRSVAPQDAHVSVEASLGRREVESTAGNESVAKIIYRIANAYGVNLSYFTIVHSQPETETTTRTESTETPGWEELRIGMVREVIFIAENLPGLVFLLTSHDGDYSCKSFQIISLSHNCLYLLCGHASIRWFWTTKFISTRRLSDQLQPHSGEVIQD